MQCSSVPAVLGVTQVTSTVFRGIKDYTLQCSRGSRTLPRNDAQETCDTRIKLEPDACKARY